MRHVTILTTLLLFLFGPPVMAQEPTATPDPYEGLRITELIEREYGGGEVKIETELGDEGGFMRYVISYPSDDLTIYGFINVPIGSNGMMLDGTFPVIIMIHGYVSPESYDTFDYTTRYADAMARAGFIVLHPNLRGYRPSDSGDDRFRVGKAIDVLNLIALVREQGGKPGALQQANPERIGLWGHSMGGGITLRTIVVDPEVRGAVLYGSMSGDELLNYSKILEWSGGGEGIEELATPPEELVEIGALYYIHRIETPISIHHGEVDETVPLAWSLDLCNQLIILQKPVECFTYPGQPHTFIGDGRQLFIERTIQFFNAVLRS